MYGRKWRKVRAGYLAQHPLCRMCEGRGLTVAATVVDHVERHSGDLVKFWNNDFQPLCKPCHDGAKQREELGQIDHACGVDGWPLSPLHDWNRGKRNATQIC